MGCNTLGFPVHHQLPEIAHILVHQVGDAIEPSHTLSSPSPPAFNFSQHQVFFQRVSSLHQVVKVLKFQLQHQSFQWLFRTDFLYYWCFGLLAVQGTLKSLLQQHSSKTSILWCSAFFMVQLSHPCMWKIIALIRQTFVSKVMSLLFNALSLSQLLFQRVRAFYFHSWDTNCSDFESQENKVFHCFHSFPIHMPWSDGTGLP